jgi:mono/diheme cytochrome c family protein
MSPRRLLGVASLALGAALALGAGGTAFGAGGAGGAGGAAGAAGEKGLDSVPAAVPVRANPYGGSGEGVLAGRKLYLRHCAECHGADAHGSRRGPTLETERVREAPPGALLWFLTNGRLAAGMPGWSRLPAARRWQIIAYLQRAAAAAPGGAGLSGGPPSPRSLSLPAPAPIGR